MNQCPKCKSILNNDEKASGKCFSCGATFESNLPQNTISEINYGKNEFSFVSFIIPETVTIISGVIFLGFSEVIKLLQEISNKLK